MFMANLSLANPIYDEAGPLYDSNILSEVQDHDDYIDNVAEYHEVHKMQNDIQPNCVVDSDTEHTSDSTIISYEQMVKDNAEEVIQSNVSAVPNYALMIIINDMHEQDVQCVSANEQSKVVIASLTAKLARYKEQVELYERRVKFELTEREQEIYEQLRIIITGRNIKEESLKKELHYVKMQLNSTIGHNKLMREEVATLKKGFKQKENKYLEDFLDMKALQKRKCDETERKNLVIVNENLIANWLTQEMFYTATDSMLTTTTSLLNEIENLKAQIKGKMQCVTIDNVKPKVLAPVMYAIDVDPIPPRHRNNREVHLEYLKHLKESVETVREIVKEAKIKNPLDNVLESACLYTKRSQKLLEYVIGTCPKEINRGTIWRGAGNLAKSIQEDVQLQRIEGVFKKTYKAIMRGRMANIVKNLVIEDLIEVVNERERDTIAKPSVVGQKADLIDRQDQPN
nr:hypothetical protein [Tanacetum cinerariifolium]